METLERYSEVKWVLPAGTVYDKVADISGWKKVAVIVPQSEKMQELIGELMDENAAKA